MGNSFSLVLVLLTFVLVGCFCSKPPQTSNSNLTKPLSIAKASPTPVVLSAPIQKPDAQENVFRGGQIYKRIESRHKLPVMFGWRAANIKLLIPTEDWNRLSQEEKVDLSYYAQKLPSQIRKNPEPFVDQYTKYLKAVEQLERGGEFDGLSREAYIKQASNICDVCWDITLGTLKGGGFYDDETPVKGANVESFQSSSERQH